MGGIPFQSSGCSTCRKRKIKCDLGRPECSRCIKKGTHCPGYVENRNILAHRLVSQHTRHGLANRPIAHLTENPYSVSPRTELNTNTEVRTQIFAGFMNSLFTYNTLLEGSDDSWYMLMARFPSMAGDSELVDRSVISLAATFLAKKTDDNQLKRHGVEIYNSAIGLARMLQRNCKPTLEMFYAMIIFHTYELMQTSEDMLRNCFSHVQGATAILKHLDCTDNKEKSFLQAMLIRQKWAATFFILNKKYRSQVNWECFFIGTEASPLDRLFGILAESAFVQLSLDQIEEHRPPNIKEEYTLLLCRCQEIEENLGYWLSSYASSLGGRPTPGERHLEYDPRTIPLKTAHAPYEFSSLTTAKTYLLFWVALLVVRRAFYHIERFLGKAPNLSPMLFCADEICRSTAFCMQSKYRISAVQITLFAVSQAAQCYMDCGDDESYTWCQNVYPIGKPSGFTTVQIFASRLSDHRE